MASHRTIVDEIIEKSIDQLPMSARQAEEAGREQVQTVVWVVGLSGGLLTLASVNERVLDGLGETARSAFFGVLALTVCLGVAQRIVYHVTEIKGRMIMWSLISRLTGWTSEAHSPDELSEEWSREEIVRRLGSDFRYTANYSFLVTNNVPIDKCREIYKSVYERDEQWELERLLEWQRLVAIHIGSREHTMEELKAGIADRTLSDERSKGRSYQRWLRAAWILFIGSTLGFAAAIVMLAISAIAQQ